MITRTCEAITDIESKGLSLVPRPSCVRGAFARPSGERYFVSGATSRSTPGSVSHLRTSALRHPC